MIDLNKEQLDKYGVPTSIAGVPLTEKQQKSLSEGKTLYIQNMTNRKQQTTFNSYIRYSKDKGKYEFVRQKQEQKIEQKVEQQEKKVITWALGHLITLSMPESYGYGAYRAEDLPICPKPFQLIVRQVRRIRSLRMTQLL